MRAASVARRNAETEMQVPEVFDNTEWAVVYVPRALFEGEWISYSDAILYLQISGSLMQVTYELTKSYFILTQLWLDRVCRSSAKYSSSRSN